MQRQIAWIIRITMVYTPTINSPCQRYLLPHHSVHLDYSNGREQHLAAGCSLRGRVIRQDGLPKLHARNHTPYPAAPWLDEHASQPLERSRLLPRNGSSLAFCNQATDLGLSGAPPTASAFMIWSRDGSQSLPFQLRDLVASVGQSFHRPAGR